MARLLTRLVAMNDGWARPFGEFNRRWAAALFRPIKPIRDLLNGRWLGHPLHAAVTDIPIGLLLGVVVLDLLNQPAAADIVLVATIVFMLLSAIAGLADYSETDGRALTRATLHATLMTVALLVLIVSAVLRSGAPADRTLPIALSIVALLVVTAGAFVGGDVAYFFGNMVNRHAFRGAGTKWVRLDTGHVTDLSKLAEATPTKMKAGANDLVVVRIGETVHAMHNVCAHAGGPLNEGRVVDGCIECPWHFSRYRLTDGLAK
jgi:nitrite reductase/ring-hydroxylating ferredoxin subunit